MHGAAVLSALGNTLAAPSGTAVGWIAGKANRAFPGTRADEATATANVEVNANVEAAHPPAS